MLPHILSYSITLYYVSPFLTVYKLPGMLISEGDFYLTCFAGSCYFSSQEITPQYIGPLELGDFFPQARSLLICTSDDESANEAENIAQIWETGTRKDKQTRGYQNITENEKPDRWGRIIKWSNPKKIWMKNELMTGENTEQGSDAGDDYLNANDIIDPITALSLYFL